MCIFFLSLGLVTSKQSQSILTLIVQTIVSAVYGTSSWQSTKEPFCAFSVTPKGYHRIKVHLVFAVKFDGRHKARLVADGHLAPEPIENIYSGVVSLRNLRLVIFLGRLNHLDLWGVDIGNAYLEAFTDEKIYIVDGPEFQELEGYILIFLKALYGLKSSGKRWAEVIHGILRDMEVLPLKADPYIWIRKAPNLRCYEYIAVYVDDLCIAAESPSVIIQIFKSKYH